MTVQSANIFDNSAATTMRRNLNTDSAEGIKQVARQFEALFVQQMLKSMRQATPGDDMFSNEGTDQYMELADQQMALSMSQSGGGMGIAAMVERQLREQAGLDVDRPATGGKQLADYGRLPVQQVMASAEAAARADSGKDWLPDVGTALAANQAGRQGGGEAMAPALGGKGHGWDNRDEFIRDVWPAALRTADKLDADPRALVAQAALETGWGQHVIRRGNGESANNLFGIKASPGWTGDTVRVPTLEYRDGIARREMAEFRAYDSLEESFEDYFNFLQANPRYRGALAVSNDPTAFTNALQSAGYATDPQYARKIQSIMGGETLNQGLDQLKNSDAVSTLF